MIDTLRRDGVLRLPSLSPESAAAILNSLTAYPIYDGHIVGHPGAGETVRPDSTQTCWGMDAVITAPEIVETAVKWTALAGDYLESDPLLYSINAFTMHPSSGPTSLDTQEFHRDRDDVRFLALFLYLTDVNEPEDGAHQYQRGTQTGAASGPVETICGPAGTLFLSDGRGLHRGLRPTSKPRSIVWIRWGVSDPPASYQWTHSRPCDKAILGDRYPTDPEWQRSARLVLA